MNPRGWWALLRKEVQEHWITCLILGVCVALFLVIFGLVAMGDGLPPLVVFQRQLTIALPLVAWVLGGRLVRREYGGRTQLFLEALPASRFAVVAVKYALGGALLVLFAAANLAVCVLFAQRSGGVDAALLGVVLLRAAAYLWLLHASCFLLGFLGRYRTALVLLACVVVAYVVGSTDIELSQMGPLPLIDHTLPFERHEVPWRLIGLCSGSAVLITVSAFGVASLREGSVAARLAHEMSQRERAFVAIVVLACLVGLATYDEKRPKDPFEPETAARVDASGLSVVVGAGDRLSPDEAGALATSIHRRLDAAREHLGIEELPPVYLFSRHGLDPDRYEQGRIEDEAGLVVRVNAPSPGWDEDHFVAWLLDRVLTDHSHGRARREPRRWVLDGFSEWWAHASAAESSAADADVLWLRALYGVPDGVDAALLDRWETFRDAVGDDVASAVAWSGLRTLESRHGADVARAAHVAILGVAVPDDVRALWHAGDRDVVQVIAEHAGTTPSAFLAAWNEDLDAERRRLAERLAAIPRLHADAVVLTVSDASREVRYSVRLDGDAEAALRLRFEWTSLDAFDSRFDDDRPESDHVDLGTASAGRVLPQSFARGVRLAWRIAHRADVLGCDVISGVQRTVLR